jgi:RNA:NAD 2'-phosphotransferase (TPT1/KptA family)
LLGSETEKLALIRPGERQALDGHGADVEVRRETAIEDRLLYVGGKERQAGDGP